MKKWLPFLWIVPAALVIAAGALLPEYILTNTAAPEFDLDYSTVTVSAQDTTDYYWRLLHYANYANANFPRGYDSSTMTVSDISYYTDGEIESMIEQWMEEANTLSETGVLPSVIMTSLRAGTKVGHVYYYFDAETMRGFQVGTLNSHDSSRDVAVNLSIDISSGKILSIYVINISKQQIENAYAQFDSWQDMLRAYGEYLGLETETDTPETVTDSEGNVITQTVAQKVTYVLPNAAEDGVYYTVTLSVVDTLSYFFIIP